MNVHIPARFITAALLASLAITIVKAEETEAIVREAYLYGYPLVESYKTLHKQALDPSGPDYKAPINQIGHSRGVATPDDKFVVTPNSDTPYSYSWIDLRAEPMVVTMPEIEAGRYYSAQLIDLYTHNFAYLGTRSHGNDGGNFMITGPSWKGEKPPGIRSVIPCETEIFYALFRTQLFNPEDLPKVHKIQNGYAVRPLSVFLKQEPKPAAPVPAWPPRHLA